MSDITVQGKPAWTRILHPHQGQSTEETEGTMHRLNSLMLLHLLVLSLACDSSPAGQEDSFSYTYEVPEEMGDGWEPSSLSGIGLDPDRFEDLMFALNDLGDHHVHSILLARENRLAFEEYFDGPKFSLAQPTGEAGFGPSDTHNLASVTKSITTTLFGIAVDQGHIQSVHQRVFDFFPEHTDLVDEDPRRGLMTLADLLLMRSGIVWNDEEIPYSDPNNDLARMFNVSDPIGYALSKPLYAAPGTVFDYCNANTNILGEIIKRATGRGLDVFAAESLFGPLGITAFEWQMMPNQVVFASGDLRLRPRDMAKIGLLFLQSGTWAGDTVVSEGWIQVATGRHVVTTGPHAWADGYGYGWWHWDLSSGGENHPAYLASGWGGQWIVVIPRHNLVFVSTAGNYYTPVLLSADRMLMDYVLPAVQ
jgi:CubicO group peptidase (beta-lactamase class C family)